MCIDQPLSLSLRRLTNCSLPTDYFILFPQDIPLSKLLIWRRSRRKASKEGEGQILPQHNGCDDSKSNDKKLLIRLNYVTAPLLAVLFLLAISAIGRQEIHDGIIGADNISPIDIMLFFFTLAYIAISIDASGLIRYLAFRVLLWGGQHGHRLYFYLYFFFFGLGSFIGNDPVILSGTAFLAYMTRVARNIDNPQAWIYAQFAAANTASAILVSSNPTNLVLAGAFDIKFVHYTANIVVPVIVTSIVLFPFLLYLIFAKNSLIPKRINIHNIPDEAREKTPVNPNIPYVTDQVEMGEEAAGISEELEHRMLAAIMNPYLHKESAAVGAIVMATTLITLLALDAASTGTGKHPAFWVTLPAAVVMLCWDLSCGWKKRKKTRETAEEARKEREDAHKRELDDKVSKLANEQELTVLQPSSTLTVPQLILPHSTDASQNGEFDGKDFEISQDTTAVTDEDATNAELSQARTVQSSTPIPTVGEKGSVWIQPSSSPLSCSASGLTPVTQSVSEAKAGHSSAVSSAYDGPKQPSRNVETALSWNSDGIKAASLKGERPKNDILKRKAHNLGRGLVGLLDERVNGHRGQIRMGTGDVPFGDGSNFTSTFRSHTVCVLDVHSRTIAVYKRMGTTTRLRMGSLGQDDWNSGYDWRYGISVSHVLQCKQSSHVHLCRDFTANRKELMGTEFAELSLTCSIASRNEHRRRNHALPCHSSLAADQPQQWNADQRAIVLRNSVQHGPWCELWRLQYHIRRFAGGAALARYPEKEANTR